MNDKSPYTKRVTHTFTADDQEWAVTDFYAEQIGFEETRKNGQEDCHMIGEAVLVDGKWKLEDYTRRQIEMYTGKETADAIEAFFDEHGPPTDAVESETP